MGKTDVNLTTQTTTLSPKQTFILRNKEIGGITTFFVISFLALSALSYKKVGSFSKIGEKGAIGFLSGATISSVLGILLCKLPPK